MTAVLMASNGKGARILRSIQQCFAIIASSPFARNTFETERRGGGYLVRNGGDSASCKALTG